MTLDNTRELGVHHRIGFRHNDVCRRAAGPPELACTHKREYPAFHLNICI
jgi:hypothetical protein